MNSHFRRRLFCAPTCKDNNRTERRRQSSEKVVASLYKTRRCPYRAFGRHLEDLWCHKCVIVGK
jgi:hypothetical protein